MTQADFSFVFHQGTAPLLISMPHAGTALPAEIAEALNDAARQVPDTDWHMPALYAGAQALGASVLGATYSRYVVDLNRPPNGESLYPGQSVTGLCPVDSFADMPLYTDGRTAVDADEVQRRRTAYWQPYHTQLRAELERLLALHGKVVLWDAHSIRSVLPRFFAGKLPDLNLGTADGTSCDAALAQQLLGIAEQATGHTAVLNGRFKGGYITSHYGEPARGIHAVQLEMTQCSYLQAEAPPFAYSAERAARIQPTLQQMLQAALNFARA